MNASKFLAVSLFAVAAAGASVASYASEAEATQYSVQFNSSRTRAEVNAEAVAAVGDRSQELAAMGVTTIRSTAARADVRANAVAALRAGQISSGEASE